MCASPAQTTIGRLRLEEHDVVKATKSATVHLRFQPRADTLIIAGGDKEGHVSLWHIERREPHPTDGVFMFSPHRQYVSGRSWVERTHS